MKIASVTRLVSEGSLVMVTRGKNAGAKGVVRKIHTETKRGKWLDDIDDFQIKVIWRSALVETPSGEVWVNFDHCVEA